MQDVVDEAKERLSKFFFGELDTPASWDAIIGQYRQLNYDLTKGMPWTRSGADDTLKAMDPVDEEILKEKAELHFLE